MNTDSINPNKKVMAAKIRFGDEGFTFFTGYVCCNSVRSVCVILRQMS